MDLFGPQPPTIGRPPYSNCVEPGDWAEAFHEAHPNSGVGLFALSMWFTNALAEGYKAGMSHAQVPFDPFCP